MLTDDGGRSVIIRTAVRRVLVAGIMFTTGECVTMYKHVLTNISADCGVFWPFALPAIVTIAG